MKWFTLFCIFPRSLHIASNGALRKLKVCAKRLLQVYTNIGEGRAVYESNGAATAPVSSATAFALNTLINFVKKMRKARDEGIPAARRARFPVNLIDFLLFVVGFCNP